MADTLSRDVSSRKKRDRALSQHLSDLKPHHVIYYKVLKMEQIMIYQLLDNVVSRRGNALAKI